MTLNQNVVTPALRLFMALKNNQFVSFCFLTKLQHWFLILPWQWSFHPACFAPCRLESDCGRLDFSLSPLHKEQLCLNGDTAYGNICCRQNSKCCTRGLEKKEKQTNEKREVQRKKTRLHLFFWLISQSGQIPPKSPRWERNAWRQMILSDPHNFPRCKRECMN